MNIKTYIVKRAIDLLFKQQNNEEKVNDKEVALMLKLADKFNNKIIVSIEKSTIPDSDKRFVDIIKRSSFDMYGNKVRFLEYDKKDKITYYIKNDGEIVYQDYVNKQLLPASDEVKYIWSQLTDYVKNNGFGETIKYTYMLIGQNEKHNFYIDEQGKYYYSLIDTSTNIQPCTENMLSYCSYLLTQIGEG